MLDSSDDESDSANLREVQDSLQMDDDDLSESDSIVIKEENILNKVRGYLTEEKPASDQRPQIQKQQKRKFTMRPNN